MNNRKQLNKRGKNPRSIIKQVIVESENITRIVEDQEVILPNPRFGIRKVVFHRSK